ncbi:MAG: MarC family protein, partial [Thermoplasmatota archaeon]
LAFLVMLNPFAIFVYVKNVREELPDPDYYSVLLKANVISFIVYFFFAAFGGFLFNKIFNIDFESFRIFGGIVLLSLALVIIIQGRKSVVTLKGSLDDIASEVAIPFMVGPGTISVSIIIGNEFDIVTSVLIIALAMLISFAIVYILSRMRKHLLNQSARKAFDKKLGTYLRLNGFFIGAIGVNMVITGINNLYVHTSIL